MSKVHIALATPEETREAIQGSGLPANAYLARENGQIIAVFGLCWAKGRCWLWFGATPAAAKHPHMVVKWAGRMKRQAAQFGETEIYTPRDDEFATSKRLLEFLGFSFACHEPNLVTGEQQEIWKCPVSKSSAR